MTLKLVYTYTSKSNFRQDIIEIEFCMAMLESPQALARTALSQIPEKRHLALIRVDCCVIASVGENDKLATWYVDGDGRLIFSNGRLLGYVTPQIPAQHDKEKHGRKPTNAEAVDNTIAKSDRRSRSNENRDGKPPQGIRTKS